MLSDTQIVDILTLSIVQKHNIRQMQSLLTHYGSASAALQTLNADTGAARRRAEKELAFIQQHNIRTWYYQDEDYPYRLKNCPDAPIMLFSKGNMSPNGRKNIAIVGTRAASERGKEQTRKLVLDLAKQIPDVTIISGLAYGIDIAAHRAALEAGLPTIIVPAHGLDRIYPNLHRPVAIQALEQGGLITEYMSGTEPIRSNFVARNRIIAGLSDAVVVIESKERGGSLITAHMALDYNRDVFTFPGRPQDETSRGCNQLIKQNCAALIENADDLITALQWEPKQPVQTELVELFVDLSDRERTLLDLLHEEEEGIHINLLTMETQWNYSDVVATLTMMEYKDLVKSLPGGIYRALK